MDYALKTILIFERIINQRLTMVLRTLLIPKGQKEVEKGEGLFNTSRRREKRGKAHEASTVNFGVWNALCELSIYRESSQLISGKL